MTQKWLKNGRSKSQPGLEIEEVKGLIEAVLNEDYERSVQAARPGWKSEVMALGSARGAMESVQADGMSAEDYAGAVLDAWDGKKGPSFDEHDDPYSFGNATFGALASALRDKLRAAGMKV